MNIIDAKNGLAIIKLIEKLSERTTILSNFISAFKEYSEEKNEMHYLFGNYKVPSTISGRPTSSKPNLLNIPSTGTKYAKPVKKCFVAPVGRLIVGADYKAQEHKANALITKDKNMLAEYESGLDGHSSRAYKYFTKKFPNSFRKKINKAEKKNFKLYVKLINSIEDLYSSLRQDSKSPTFLLQFGGTIHGLMRKFGFTEKEAQHIVDSFEGLYKTSINWVKGKIKKAHKNGYVVGAFNLRLKTPVLHQTVHDSVHTPYAAEAEARSAGNMISGQSYGLLTLRAFGLFMKRVRANKKRALFISPWATIYDAIYLEIPNTIDYLMYVNKHLIHEMKNIEGCPELKHPNVKMGAVLCIYYPDWSNEIKIPNKATKREIKKILKKNNVPFT